MSIITANSEFDYANIMLDLECADAHIDNPAIIQLGAVYFDLETGESFAELDISINLDSCIAAGLKVTGKGMEWLERNIPACLERSRISPTSLRQALQEFNKFVTQAKVHTRLRRASSGHRIQPQVNVWGNGALADNVWIRSAYRACAMTRPWEYYNDTCLRTFVRQVELITSEKYCWNSRERTGIPRAIHEPMHDALSDCKYQIRYLVAARGAILKMRTAVRMVDDESKPAVNARRKANARIRHGLQTPKTSFSEVPQKPSFMTPKTSFSEQCPGELVSMVSITPHEQVVNWTSADIGTPCYKKDRLQDAIISAGKILPTPDVSFSIPNYDQSIDNKASFPTSPSTDYGDLEAGDFDRLEAGIQENTTVTQKRASDHVEIESKAKRVSPAITIE